MVAITAKHFDSLGFVKSAKGLGVKEEIAEHQARQIEQAIDIAVATAREEVHAKDLATKQDIKNIELNIKNVEIKIEQSKNQTILWVSGILGAYGLFFLGILAKGFHWF